MHHLIQPRGKETGYLFRIAIPRGLWGRFGMTAKGTPRRHIVEGLGVDSKAEARKLRDQRVAAWRLKFERARLAVPLTAEEIAAEAREAYRFRLDSLAVPGAVSGDPILDDDGQVVETPEYAGLNAALDWEREHDGSLEAAPYIAAVERRLGVVIKAGTDTHKALARAILEARLEALYDRLKIIEGRTPEALPVREAPMAKARAVKIIPGDGLKFSQAAELFLAEVGGSLRQQTVDQYRTVHRLFADHAGDHALASITRTHAAEFLAQMGSERGVSNRTLNQYSSALGQVFRWARKRGKLDGANPFEDQAFKLPKTATGYLPFTNDEIGRLLVPKPGDDPLHWTMLIAAYTGARINEIAQLRREDIKDQDGIHFFDLHEGDGQKLKTKAATRRVPVHSALLKAGLLEYAQGEGRLFPTLVASGPDKKPGKRLGERFTNYRRALGIVRPRVSFHSFRSTVITTLNRAGVHSADIGAVVGHSQGFTLDTYSGGAGLKRLQEIIERVGY